MKKIMTQVRLLATISLLVAGLVLTQLVGVSKAHAAVNQCTNTDAPITLPTSSVRTWTGAGSDSNFSTAANWSGNTVPITGDTIVFNSLPGNSGNYYSVNLTDDLSTSTYLGGVIVDSTSLTTPSSIAVIGTLRLAAGATLQEAGCSLSFSLGAIAGQGSLNIAGGWGLYNQATIAGGLSVDGRTSYANLAVGGTGTFSGVTSLTLANHVYLNVDGDINFPITVQPGATASINVSGTYDINTQSYAPTTVTISSNLNLSSDMTVSGSSNATVNLTGTITGSGSVKRDIYADPSFVLNVNGTALVNPVITTQLDGVYATTDTSSHDPNTADYTVVNNETATLDGQRASVTVNKGGILMGTGSAQYITVSGVIAPGHSPGTLTATSGLDLGVGSIYQAQIKDATAGDYDQIVVGSSSDTTGHDISIDPTANLDVSLYSGYNIKKGDTFTIINNLSQTSVSGTFAGLAEGATITVAGVQFSISYVGGDGNDVVLTALNSGVQPSAPNTAVQILKLASPYVSLIATIAVLGAGIGIMRLRKQSTK